MKIQTAIIITLAIVIIIGLVGVVPFNPTQNTYAIKQPPGGCPSMNFLWEHTYGAGKSHWSGAQTHSRLRELTPACVVFEGVISNTPQGNERDGDLHFSAIPDGTAPNDNWGLLNKNNTDTIGRKVLTIEVICYYQPDYKKYSNFNGHFCDGVDPTGHIPSGLKQGDHIRVTGKWVQDIGYPAPDHLQWNEIHPVESIQRIP